MGHIWGGTEKCGEERALQAEPTACIDERRWGTHGGLGLRGWSGGSGGPYVRGAREGSWGEAQARYDVQAIEPEQGAPLQGFPQWVGMSISAF